MVALGFTEGVVGPGIVEAVESRGFRVLYASTLVPVLAIETTSLESLVPLSLITAPYEARDGAYSWVDELPFRLRLLRRRFLGGAGVKVGIIDSGLSLPRASPVTDAIVDTRDFTGNGMRDLVGHGTLVIEIIHEYAPDAKLYVAKAGEDRPQELLILKALDWCADNNVNVVNVSAGVYTPDGCRGTCAICAAVTALRRRGIIATVAAGNGGPSEGTILCPGNSPDAITVGAYDRRARGVANYSSVGRRDQSKPDLVCGVPRVYNSRGAQEGGTSFASPVVAGIIAACMTHYGGDEVSKLLVETARDLGAPRNVQGAGCLNLDGLLEALVNGGHIVSAN